MVGPAVPLCVALLLDPDLAAPAVGQTTPPPTFSVSADAPATARGSVELSPTTGAMVRAIAIDVPSFHGIEPRLALSYSSLSGSGFAGVGWALTGFSVIERTRNGRGTPRFTSSDVYVLDGQELLPCSQASSSPGCLAGGTHATKQESYAKIRGLGRPSPTAWTIWSRNGTRTEFTAVYAASGGTWRWGQRSVIDTHANTVTYSWECSGGDCYPRSVSFGPFAVTMYREPRPDVLSFATGGLSGLGKTRDRLRTIAVTRGSVLIRAYALTYVSSGVTARSLLQSVQQYGTNASVDPASGQVSGAALIPPQAFAYQGAE
jgi:hypothetical protein